MRKKENKEDLGENRQMTVEMIRKRRMWKIEKERKPTNKSPKQAQIPNILPSHIFSSQKPSRPGTQIKALSKKSF